MARDQFVLFYSRFLHLAPTIGKVSKDDPDFDSKHHVRCSVLSIGTVASFLILLRYTCRVAVICSFGRLD